MDKTMKGTRDIGVTNHSDITVLTIEFHIPLWISYTLFAQDINVTWNTATPDFTPCFQRTVLSWTPIAFLVLFSPLRYWYLADREPAKDQIRTKLSVSKYVSLFILELVTRIVCMSIQEWQYNLIVKCFLFE